MNRTSLYLLIICRFDYTKAAHKNNNNNKQQGEQNAY